MGRFLPGKAMLALVHLWYSEQKNRETARMVQPDKAVISKF